MPITPAISVSQSALTPGTITIQDVSTGSDGAITQRRAFFQTPQATYLVGSGVTTDYMPWAYADTSESFAVLPSDYALAITIQWLNVGNTVLYTLTQIYCFPQFNKNFFYGLLQQQALQYEIISDQPYFKNLAIFWVNIVGAIQAIEIGADVAASQACLNRATFMQDNQVQFFQN